MVYIGPVEDWVSAFVLSYEGGEVFVLILVFIVLVLRSRNKPDL
jgi:uncharacterized membrane protein